MQEEIKVMQKRYENNETVWKRDKKNATAQKTKHN